MSILHNNNTYKNIISIKKYEIRTINRYSW